jgi:hypothetical protein
MAAVKIMRDPEPVKVWGLEQQKGPARMQGLFSSK